MVTKPTRDFVVVIENGDQFLSALARKGLPPIAERYVPKEKLPKN